MASLKKEEEKKKEEKRLIGRFTSKGLTFDYDEFCEHVGFQSVSRFLKLAKFSKTKRMGQKYSTRESCFYKIVEVAESNIKRRYLIFARFMLDDVITLIRDARAKRGLSPMWSAQNAVNEGLDIPEERLEPGPTLDANQETVLSYLMESIYTPTNLKKAAASCVVVMGTGSGKSYIAAAVVGELGKRTLCIAPSAVVLNETRQALKSSYPELIIGEYTSESKKHADDGDVVLMIINSALSDTFTIDGEEIPFYKYFAKFGLLILDEIHNYTSAARQELFWRTNFKYGLGLTATPDENPWEMDIVFQKHVGPLIRDKSIPGYNMQRSIWKGAVFPIHYQGPEEYTKEIRQDATGWVSYPLMVNQFNADPYRNRLIISKLKTLWKDKRNTFVFVITRDYANQLALLFTQSVEDELDKTITPDAVVLMGGAKQKDMASARRASIVFTTYSFGWQGVSIPKMDTIFFANPRMAKMRQILGRIIRKGGDIDIVRHIYDIVDVKTNLGVKEYKERVKIYEESVYYDFELQKEEVIRWDSLSL
jgi:superfamily II DNA or RNA helicase